jgi:hypothetical protein
MIGGQISTRGYGGIDPLNCGLRIAKFGIKNPCPRFHVENKIEKRNAHSAKRLAVLFIHGGQR